MKYLTHIIPGGILCALGPLLVLAGTVYTLMLPNIYESTAVILVAFPENTKERYTEDALIALTRRQAALVGTSPILYSVINELKLQDKWGRGGERLTRNVARDILESSLNVYADKQAVGLIHVSVRRANPWEAAEIANEILMANRHAYGDVRVVEIAEPNVRPVSPNLFRNVLISLIGAILLSMAGIGLLICGIKKRRIPAGM